MTKRRIVVPIDFSPCSHRALTFAVGLARELDAEVDLLHVWEPSPQISATSLLWMNGSQNSFWDNLHRDLERQLEKVAAAADPERKVVTNISVVADYVAGAVIRTLERDGYDMCVIGTRGRTGLARLLLGSVAARVVRLAPCPVITVPAAEAVEDAHTAKKEDAGAGFDLATPTNL